MMVNQMNNSGAPWQSTIPTQIPWMNTIPTGTLTRFGQTHLAPNDPQTVVNPLTGGPISQVPAAQIPLVQPPNPELYNPFDPNQVLNQAPPLIASTTNQPASDLIILNNMTVNDTSSIPQTGNFQSSFLTQLPQQQQPQSSISSFDSLPLHQKRSSVEMEDEITVKEAPPTKQQLSESRLFKRFGSLQLDSNALSRDEDADVDSDDSGDDKPADSSPSRSEFNRYVYLLFKDKKSNNLFDNSTSRAMDRLLREERDKLNKAVILWNPPVKNFYVSEAPDSDEDDELNYKDHRDFLKKDSRDDDSIIITEVEDDLDIQDVSPVPDDVMQD